MSWGDREWVSQIADRGGNDLRIILDLGSQPIANALLSEEEVRRPEAARAIASDLDSPPDVLPRRDYPYFSLSSPRC